MQRLRGDIITKVHYKYAKQQKYFLLPLCNLINSDLVIVWREEASSCHFVLQLNCFFLRKLKMVNAWSHTYYIHAHRHTHAFTSGSLKTSAVTW